MANEQHLNHHSEVARLQEQITLEYQAAQRGLVDLASGTARHQFINQRLTNIGDYQQSLAALVGEEPSMQIVYDLFSGTLPIQSTIIAQEVAPDPDPSDHLTQAQTRCYLTAQESAKKLGLSTRSVYSLVKNGTLPSCKIVGRVAIHVNDLHNLNRPTVGRARTTTPIWRASAATNQQYITTIDVAILNGKSELLAQKLTDIRVNKQHLLPGTVARYISLNPDQPTTLHILFVWRRSLLPSEAERQTAISALQSDLADCLAWSQAQIQEWPVFLHTN
jgi:excisionase family DNA binding protein